MYIITRNHTEAYFVCKKGSILSWSSRKADAYGYKTLVGVIYVIQVLKYLTGDNSIKIGV